MIVNMAAESDSSRFPCRQPQNEQLNFVGSSLHGQDLQVSCTTYQDSLAREFIVRQASGRGLNGCAGLAALVLSLLILKGMLSSFHALLWAGLLLLVFWIKCSFIDVVEESVLVVKNLGLQVKVKYASGRETIQFIELNAIADVIINEAITMHKVLFYLALFVKDNTQDTSQKRLEPLLMATVPRLETIKPIYYGIRQMLFAEKAKGSSNKKTL